MSACVGQRVARADDFREAVDQSPVEFGDCDIHDENLGRIERQVTRRGGAAQPVVDGLAETGFAEWA